MDEDVKELIQGLFPLDGMEAEGFCVNSKELHRVLGVGRDYSTWIKARIAKYGFEEDFDYIIVQNLSSPDLGNSKSRQQVQVNYYVTLSVAKELAMIENNEIGRAIRKYFIQCEKTLRTITPEITEELQQQILATESLMQSDGTLSLAEIAQLLGKGRNRYAKELREKGVLKSNNTPYQKHMEAGHFELKLVEVCNRVVPVTRVTAKGAIYLKIKENL